EQYHNVGLGAASQFNEATAGHVIRFTSATENDRTGNLRQHIRGNRRLCVQRRPDKQKQNDGKDECFRLTHGYTPINEATPVQDHISPDTIFSTSQETLCVQPVPGSPCMRRYRGPPSPALRMRLLESAGCRLPGEVPASRSANRPRSSPAA